MAEIDPSWPASPRAIRASLKRQHHARARELARSSGRSSVPTSMSRKGVGTWRLTTRIISSGVMPLAAIEATKAPALVPT